ncbi:hypothetical protein FHY11_002979 [Xanthomonas arboricola]|uniref:hypothetical protein n=1 Tax=Xanthomonas euroxanthea TaxID=2259622 RepID=UPI00141BA82C|nr:hypothetical protein [Xanthomonas euroxanthea]NIK09447.1 hypothetical protein [Xanthomonas euroxanthea]
MPIYNGNYLRGKNLSVVVATFGVVMAGSLISLILFFIFPRGPSISVSLENRGDRDLDMIVKNSWMKNSSDIEFEIKSKIYSSLNGSPKNFERNLIDFGFDECGSYGENSGVIGCAYNNRLKINREPKGVRGRSENLVVVIAVSVNIQAKDISVSLKRTGSNFILH